MVTLFTPLFVAVTTALDVVVPAGMVNAAPLTTVFPSADQVTFSSTVLRTVAVPLASTKTTFAEIFALFPVPLTVQVYDAAPMTPVHVGVTLAVPKITLLKASPATRDWTTFTFAVAGVGVRKSLVPPYT